jgi:peptidoglycan DL-endopeptidase CwlO
VAIPLGLLATGVLAISVVAGVGASAASQPSVAQVQARLSHLNAKAEQLDQQYDAVQQELASAGQRLALLSRETARYTSRFQAMQSQVADIAATAYMEGSLTSPVVLLTSATAQTILNEASILQQLSWINTGEMNLFLAAAHQLTGAQQAALRTKEAETQLRNKLSAEKSALQKLIAQQQSLLNQLTPQQQQGIGPGNPITTGSPPPIGGHDPLPTSTQAEKAVQFAYDQLGCPYVFGGTGPCQDGFDCSGLTQAAWASAGVSIPRTSYEQATLPSVPLADIEPGDILEFVGDGHVGIYVGDGWLIDAPHTGAFVEKVQFSGWYSENFDGAVRP